LTIKDFRLTIDQAADRKGAATSMGVILNAIRREGSRVQ
jgi:hypothetical protein